MENKTILICDDDEGILSMLGLILEESGYKTVPVQNSLSIYQAIEQQRPHLLLLDLWMPVLSGDQVLRSLRKDPEMQRIPVIVISASRDGAQIAAEAGADYYLAKPFDINHLLEKIELYLN